MKRLGVLRVKLGERKVGFLPSKPSRFPLNPDLSKHLFPSSVLRFCAKLVCGFGLNWYGFPCFGPVSLNWYVLP
jgi:hypothetical protein